MNHKRNRPKHQRAGCLLCKPHKDERVGGVQAEAPSVRRVLQDDDQAIPDGPECDCSECTAQPEPDDEQGTTPESLTVPLADIARFR